MLKAWNKYGKEYMDGNYYKELEEIKIEICDTQPDPSKSHLKKIKFDLIPNSTNYRSGQPTLSQLAYILEAYNIKHIVRMNGDNETSPVGRKVVTKEEEKTMAECKGVEFHYITAHKPNQGTGEIVDGVTLGYTKSMEEIQKILSEGNTLIHCRNGSDRTGYQVAKYRKDRGMTDEQALWDYTLKYSGWCKQSKEYFAGGYDTYAQGFINGLDEKRRQELCNGRISYNVTNAAAESATTSKMLGELKKQNLDNYDVVIIFGGGNDGNRKITDKTAQNNLDKMFNMVKDSGTTLIVISNPTKKNSPHHKTWVKTTDAIGQHTEKSSIPDYKILVNTNLSDKEYFSDGYHLNGKAQDWIYKKLKNILDKL